MIQNTSLDAYFENLPHFGIMEQKVFDVIMKLGCPTDLEIARYLGFKDPNKVRPRRNGLVEKGVVTNCETRICSVSGRLSKSWRISVKNG